MQLTDWYKKFKKGERDIFKNLNIGVKTYVVFRDELIRDMQKNPHIFQPTEKGKKLFKHLEKKKKE